MRRGLPFVAVLGNDARWNAESQIQLRDYGADRMHGCELLPARYDQVVAALGGHGEHVERAADLRRRDRARAGQRQARLHQRDDRERRRADHPAHLTTRIGPRISGQMAPRQMSCGRSRAKCRILKGQKAPTRSLGGEDHAGQTGAGRSDDGGPGRRDDRCCPPNAQARRHPQLRRGRRDLELRLPRLADLRAAAPGQPAILAAGQVGRHRELQDRRRPGQELDHRAGRPDLHLQARTRASSSTTARR